MAKYLILIYGDEQQWDEMSAQEQRRIDDGTLPLSPTGSTRSAPTSVRATSSGLTDRLNEVRTHHLPGVPVQA